MPLSTRSLTALCVCVLGVGGQHLFTANGLILMFSHPGPLPRLTYTEGTLNGPQTPRYNEAAVYIILHRFSFATSYGLVVSEIRLACLCMKCQHAIHDNGLIGACFMHFSFQHVEC